MRGYNGWPVGGCGRQEWIGFSIPANVGGHYC